MDSRKAVLIAAWFFFGLVSLVVNMVNLRLIAESGSTGVFVTWIFGIIIFGLCGSLDPAIFFSWLLDVPVPLPVPCLLALQFVCCAVNIFWIIGFGSMKIWICLMNVPILIKFILGFIFTYFYIQRPTQLPQLSQPRPNLLANQRPTALTNFEDVEQPPPSYEECMDQRNDLPPKYEDLELPPPAYQETMV